MVSYKRIDDLIRAVKILKLDFPNVKLKIIGIGPQEEYLKKLSKNLGIEDDINFVGKISNASDLIKVLKSSHVFALPSIAEGFGIVIIEAVAAGIPYVASDIPPIREVTNGGIGGLLCEPKNYNDLALKIKTLFNVTRILATHVSLIKKKFMALAIRLLSDTDHSNTSTPCAFCLSSRRCF